MFRSDRSAPFLLCVLSMGLLVFTPLGGAETPEDQAEAVESEASEEIRPAPPRVILKSQKAPIYPPAAEAARFEGKVYLELIVAADGSVGDVRVIECTHPRVGFEEAAIEAVKKWQFEPASLEGEPVDYAMQFNLNFRSAGPGSGANAYVSFGTGSPNDDKSAILDQEGRRSEEDTRSRRSTTQQARPSRPGKR
jgi:TonB family protein